MDSTPFVLIVTGTVKEGKKEEFKSYFEPLAKHVHEHEGGCLSYQLSWGDEDANELCIFERYVSKEYLETVHWASPQFKAFGESVRAADLWVEGSKAALKYHESPSPQFGFMSK